MTTVPDSGHFGRYAGCAVLVDVDQHCRFAGGVVAFAGGDAEDSRSGVDERARLGEGLLRTGDLGGGEFAGLGGGYGAVAVIEAAYRVIRAADEGVGGFAAGLGAEFIEHVGGGVGDGVAYAVGIGAAGEVEADRFGVGGVNDQRPGVARIG